MNSDDKLPISEKSTSRPLRILIVEDSQEDVTLLLHSLRTQGYLVDPLVVATSAAMQAALQNQNQDWDLILSDHSLPSFNAVDALTVAKELRPDVPFIIVSGEMDLNQAVKLIKSGAQDYVQKNKLFRLGLTIEHALREYNLIRQRNLVEARLVDSEKVLSSVIGLAMDAVITLDAEQRILVFNYAAEAMFGCKAADVIGQHLDRFIPERFRHAHHSHLTAFGADASTSRRIGEPMEIVVRKSDGAEFPVDATISSAKVEGKVVHTAMLRDVKWKLAVAEAQRDTLVREVHHSIKNNLQGVIGLVRAHLIAHPELAELGNSIIAQVGAIAAVHGMQGERTPGHVEILALVKEITRAAMLLAPATCIVVAVEEFMAPVFLSKDAAVPVALILNELLLNAIKHKTEGARNEEVTIRLRLDSDRNLVSVIISSAGRLPTSGFDFGNGIGLGVGLSLVKALLPDSGAKLHFAEEGDRVVISFELCEPIILRDQPLANTSSAGHSHRA